VFGGLLLAGVGGCPYQTSSPPIDYDALSPPPGTEPLNTNPRAIDKHEEFDGLLYALARGETIGTVITGSSSQPDAVIPSSGDRPEVVYVDGELYVFGRWVGNFGDNPVATPPPNVPGEPPAITMTDFPPIDEPPPNNVREIIGDPLPHGEPTAPVEGVVYESDDGSIIIGVQPEAEWLVTNPIPMPGCIADENGTLVGEVDELIIIKNNPDEPSDDESYRLIVRERDVQYSQQGRVVHMQLQLQLAYRWGEALMNGEGELLIDATYGSRSIEYSSTTLWRFLVDGESDVDGITSSETRSGTLHRRE
jgi:hypothetical protein